MIVSGSNVHIDILQRDDHVVVYVILMKLMLPPKYLKKVMSPFQVHI